MTDTPNLGMPYIDGSQAQKHVTHNEALRILDAAIQVSVLDLTRTAPPSSPAEGERHVVADGATGAWAGQGNAIATWQDGAWAFLAPKTGWCIWSVADDIMFVFDGTAWQNFRSLPAAIDNALRVGVNTSASSPNLLSVKSNAALFAAIDAADGGTGDARVQVSKEAASNTASVFFSDNFSGRAEFGLVGSDAFKLKVSSDGSAWTDAFTIDQSSGNLTLPRGLTLAGVIAPAQITANQNDYNPAGIAAASVLQISADAARSISGLAGGAEGRCVALINAGSQPVTLLNESTSSSASNRFTLNGNLTISPKQAAILRYDGTAARWQAVAGGAALVPANNLSELTDAATALTNLNGVSYAVQSLTSSQQSQARANIGVEKKNYIINGAMTISQENGATSGTASGFVAVDQFPVSFSNSGSISMAQVASRTQCGSLNRLRVTVATADTSVAAGDTCFIRYSSEGILVSGLQFGQAGTRYVTLQFGVKAPAGIYGVVFKNGAANRSYVAEYTIAAGEANTDVIKSVTVPVDATGTWATDNTTGLFVEWSLMAGTTFQQAAGSWGTVNALGSPNQFNFMGTIGNAFELFDVGLYEGTAAPAFKVPDYADELRKCQRYYWKRRSSSGAEFLNVLQNISSVSAFGYMWRHPALMRAVPTMTTSGTASHFSLSNAASALQAVTTIGTLVADTEGFWTSSGWSSSTATLVAGGSTNLAFNSTSAYVAADARL